MKAEFRRSRDVEYPKKCPKCGSEMKFSDEYAGIKTPPIMWCPQCGHEEKVKE